MARTAVYHDPSFAGHATPPGHPERPERAAAALAGLDGLAAAGRLDRRPCPPASDAALRRVHSRAHLDRLAAAAPEAGLVALDPDTHMGPRSLAAARRAAGGACAAVDAVFAGAARNAFVAARPPGHHAEPDRAMGFCLFNSAAIAALHARARHGARRVAVVDFDVHHGNGTQAAFWADPDALYVSSHEWPQYPGTGLESERGVHGGIVNAPLPAGTDGPAFRAVWAERLLPALDAFAPDIVVVSAGFDAHRADPLGGLALEAADFAWLTGELTRIADAACDGRVVSLLEGGYDLDALTACVAAHVGALADAVGAAAG